MYAGAVQKLSKCSLLCKLPYFRNEAQQKECAGDLYVYLTLSLIFPVLSTW